ncbi:MAG: hypothetical protein FJ125_04730, partial [Deltaproteobacteria bacterium]|nr:hypothetical protein [Deltaproteobacteria bacterium]
VQIGRSASPRVTVLSPTSARAVVPAGWPGTVDVTVDSAAEPPSTLEQSFTYLDDSLSIDSLVPDEGPASGGSEVVLLGNGFSPDLVVRFGPVAALQVTVDSPGAARVILPAGLPGTVDVVVEQPGQPPARLVAGFTYLDDAPPPLSAVECVPGSGPVSGGGSVAISGSGFAEGVLVRFGGQEAEAVRRLSSTVLVAVVPPSLAARAGTVELQVRNPDGQTVTLPRGYTYLAEEIELDPVLEGVAPNQGPVGGGTAVAIQGRDLLGVQRVLIGGQQALALERVGPALLLCTTPPGVPGPAALQLTLDDGRTLQLPAAFFYFDPSSRVAGPTLSTIFPTAGPLAGGTPFRLQGSGFVAGARVVVGGLPADRVQRPGSTVLTGRTPRSSREGAVDVVVYHPDGRSATLSRAFSYYLPGPASPPAPRLTGLNPLTASTLGGTAVAASGDGLLPGLELFVDGIPASDVARANATRVTFAAPPHVEGPVTVTVVNPDGKFSDLEGGLTYLAEPPTVREVVPSQGPAGGFSALIMHGAGFDPQARVQVGGRDCLATLVLDPATILATTPPGEPGPADVSVLHPNGQQATLPGAFTYLEGAYLDPPPELLAIHPARGPLEGGTMARVEGRGLAPGGHMLFGGSEARDVLVVDGQVATLVTPAHAEGEVELIWLNPDGQAAVLRRGFRYALAAGAAPSIGGLTPNRGPESGGSAVIVAGAGFTQGSEVFYGGVPAASVAVLGPGFVSTLSPPHAPGAVTVTITGEDGRSTSLVDGFLYVPSPQLLGILPAFGPIQGQTAIQLGGRHFVGGATVLLGGVACPDVQVRGENLITARTPPSLPGKVDVVVRNPDGQEARLAQGFEYLLRPTLASIWPTSGPADGGTRAVVQGTSFRSGARLFLGGVEASALTVVDETTLTAILPAGPPGEAQLLLRNPDAQEATLERAFLRIDPGELGPAPTVDSCFPSAGALAGGTSVRIAGTGYLPGAQAFFAGRPATTGFVDPAHVSARTPPHPAEAEVRVELTNPDGRTGRLNGCYRYTDALGGEPAPLVGAVQPGEGPTAGGADVVVTGDYFQEGCLLLVGNRLASSVVRVGPQRIEARTPPGEPGLVSLLVTNPDGKVGWLPNAYRYLAPPRVVAVTPGEGPSSGGTTITVRGQGFVAGLQLRLSGIQTGLVQVVSAEEIRAITPPNAPGPAEVAVINPDGQLGTLPAGFVYT